MAILFMLDFTNTLDNGLLRCARNDVGMWITVPATRNDVCGTVAMT